MPMSLPSRECGLKSEYMDVCYSSSSVTPFAGVWIEMLLMHRRESPLIVTPFAGVWIEILRGGRALPYQPVTPFAGVWIEILDSYYHSLKNGSLPSRECGLKYQIETIERIPKPSLPSRECGLKSLVVSIM